MMSLGPNSSFIKYLLSFAIFISIGFVIGLSRFLNFSSMKGVLHCFYLSILFFSEFIFICSIRVYFRFYLSFDDSSKFGLCLLILGTIPISGLKAYSASSDSETLLVLGTYGSGSSMPKILFYTIS